MQLTVDGLVKGLEEALNNPKYANSAASLSRDLALQNGVCTARQLVERLVSEKSWRRAGETAKRQRTGGA
jgi:UDP:flavonoid glycosyltransferase YjiC (YdhE family)